jgi:adenosylcobinamide kinase/adenosylcobinamide-phosphate guanylyltransferase
MIDSPRDSFPDMSRPEGQRAARIVLVGGGVRTGKSRFALQRARSLGRRRVFVATAQALDGEMADRIADHARTRGADFRTIEEPLAVPETLLAVRDADVVVIDCLTLWLSNILGGPAGEAPDVEERLADDVEERLAALVAALARRAFHAVIVTNEVGMGLVPSTPLGRRFRDVAGMAHQRLAEIADELYLGAMGVMLRLRPEPVGIQPQTPTEAELR